MEVSMLEFFQEILESLVFNVKYCFMSSYEKYRLALDEESEYYVLEKLSKCDNWSIREAVASNHSCPIDVLNDLSLQDEEWTVMKTATNTIKEKGFPQYRSLSDDIYADLVKLSREDV
jgi:hypothetical protein